MARPRLEIPPNGLAQIPSFNELTLLKILGNATKRLDQNELQILFNKAFGTSTQYNEIGNMIFHLRKKGYEIDLIKHQGYCLPEVKERWV